MTFILCSGNDQNKIRPRPIAFAFALYKCEQFLVLTVPECFADISQLI